MWQLRESAPLAVARDGWVYKHDVSLPLEHFYALSQVFLFNTFLTRPIGDEGPMCRISQAGCHLRPSG